MYKKNTQFKLIVSTVIVFGFFFISAAVSHAATITVDTTTGAAGVDTFCNLEEAINSFNAGSDQGECVADLTNPYGTDDTIEFGIGVGDDTQIITDVDAQYQIGSTVTIDGLTQGNASCGVLADLSDRDLDIQLNGIELSFGIGSDGSSVTGLSILGGETFPAINAGLVSGFDLTCSNIGIDAAGTSAPATRATLISLNDADNVTIGDSGLAIGNTNIIAGANSDGSAESIVGAWTDDLTVVNNWFGFGVGPDFNEFPSTQDFIELCGSTSCGEDTGTKNNITISHNVFRGGGVTERGLAIDDIDILTISDNTMSGIAEKTIDVSTGTNVTISGNHLFENLRAGILVSAIDGALITGNYIGTDETGVFARGNSTLAPVDTNPLAGIALLGVSNALVGGDEASDRNIISGNTSEFFVGAVVVSHNPIEAAFAENIAIQGNYIGVAADGVTPLANNAASAGVIIFGDDVAVGGTTPSESNIIQGGQNGVLIFTLEAPFAAQNMSVLGNSIYNTAGVGIEIAYDSDFDFAIDTLVGPNPNDAGDTDTGPYVELNPANNLNELLNYPEIELIASYETGGEGDTEAWVAYSLDVPAGDYRVEFFRNSELADYGPGEELMGIDNITHAGASSEVFFTLLRDVDPGDYISATTTERNLATASTFGATSEFSETATAVDLTTDIMTTLPASAISQTSATINAQQSIYIPFEGGIGFFFGDESITEEEDFFEYDFVLGPIEYEDINEETGEFSVDLANINFDSEIFELDEIPLDCDTTYYVRALGIFDSEDDFVEVYADEVSFTTSTCTTDSPRRRSSSTSTSRAIATQAFNEYYGTTDTPSNNNSGGDNEGSTLNSGQCPANLIVTQNLKQGARDGQYHPYTQGTVQEVALVQEHINRILANYFDQAAGPVDGIFGPLTKQGVQRLQRTLRDEQGADLGPGQDDGIVGPMTRDAINMSCGEGTQPTDEGDLVL